MAETSSGGGNSSGYWGQDNNGDWVWIENTPSPPPATPGWSDAGGAGNQDPYNPWGVGGGWSGAGDFGGDPGGTPGAIPTSARTAAQSIYDALRWQEEQRSRIAANASSRAYGNALESANKSTTGGGGGQQGGGGGGGWSPPVVDPYAWMGDFGGPAIFKAYLRSAGERLQDYYTRFGGDPLKTLVNKYQEIKGMAPTAELRSMMVGALGWGNEVDPNTLEPVSVMPDSPLLQSLAKSGGNYAGLDKNRGVRYMGTRPWTDITRDFKQFAAPGAAIWPPT
jgi:hypothetical protein